MAPYPKLFAHSALRASAYPELTVLTAEGQTSQTFKTRSVIRVQKVAVLELHLHHVSTLSNSQDAPYKITDAAVSSFPMSLPSNRIFQCPPCWRS